MHVYLTVNTGCLENAVRVGARRVLTRRQNRLVFRGSNNYFSLTLKVLLPIPLILHRQDVFIHNRTAKTCKTLSTVTLPSQARQDAKTCKTLSTGTLSRQDAIGKHDKTHTHATRRQDVQDAFDGHAPFTRRDRKSRQDAKTCKTLSTGTLPRQDAIAKHDKTYSCITRPQDLQDAFDRHACYNL